MATECLSPLPLKLGSVVEPVPVPVDDLDDDDDVPKQQQRFAAADFEASTATDDTTETVAIKVFYPTDKWGNDDDGGTNFSSVKTIYSTKLGKDATLCSTPEAVLLADRQIQDGARAA